MLEGFLAPSSGTIRILGQEPRRGGRAWRARVGLVLQSTSLDPELTVRETLELYAPLYPRPRRVDEILELIDLRRRRRALEVGTLSGGQRRRVDLAIGIIGRPEVLFLDEPTTGLDPEARRRTWAAVENLTEAGIDRAAHHPLHRRGRPPRRPRDRARGRADRHRHDPGRAPARRAAQPRIRLPAARPVARGTAAAVARRPPRSRRHGSSLIRTADLAAGLRELVAWADAQQLDLAGLEVGPPSLEDAYLARDRRAIDTRGNDAAMSDQMRLRPTR